jgi:hypothetical protein
MSDQEPMFIGQVYNFVYLSTNPKCNQVYAEGQQQQQQTFMSEHCITLALGLMAKVILHFMMVK